MIQKLQQWAEARGYEVAWGGAEVVAAAIADVRGRHEDGEIDATFFAGELDPSLDWGAGSGAGSVVVVAVPSAAHRVTFEVDEGHFEALLPPTYVQYRPLFEKVRQDLAANVFPGARLEHAAAPAKAVAARLGLVRYGRNNVTYAEELGSWMQLCVYRTDASLPPHPVAAPELLEECASCAACLAECPTGAIDGGRLLLHAERCLTWINENPGPWPEWLPASAHNALIGCLLCQRACPVNPELPVVGTSVVFSRAETRALLGRAPLDRSSEAGVRCALAWLGQPYAEPVLGRNLSALVAACGRDAGSAGAGCEGSR